MASLKNELKAAIIARLEADSAVGAIVGAKVFDRVKAGRKMPYINYGAVDVRPADGTCLRAYEANITLHAWSVEPNADEANAIDDAVTDALHQAPMTLPMPFLLSSIEHRLSRVFLDQDGLTTHAVMEFAAYVQRQ